MTEIHIYPAFNARYYSPYMAGLRAVAGATRMRFTSRGFPRFGSDCLAIRIIGDVERKVYLHSNDMPELDPDGLEWADVFGKVNLDPSLVPAPYRSKVIALGPTFAIRLWGPLVAELRGCANYVLSRGAPGSVQTHLANYRGQYRSRFPESYYRPAPSRADYVFYNAALWEREPEANALRARFVEAARATPGVRFEGGLTPRRSARGSAEFHGAGFEAYLCRRYGSAEYVQLTRESAVVLNNPAYRDCHSWRLAEYLALGKAIVSTPIVRALPAPLEHGVHVHYVDGSLGGFRDAIARICGDDEYRRGLERHARTYYRQFVSPRAVVRRILDRALGGVSRSNGSTSCSDADSPGSSFDPALTTTAATTWR